MLGASLSKSSLVAKERNMPLCQSVPKKARDLTGQRFGHWFVAGYAGQPRCHQREWWVICTLCGRSRRRLAFTLLNGTSTSCCQMHKRRLWTVSDLLGRLSGTEDVNRCWEWSGYSVHGYGSTSHDGKRITTHRLSWMLHFGDIPESKWVLHKCDNPACCNPHHLFLGNHQDNVDDKVAKGRQVRGSRAARSKLSEQQALSVIRMLKSESKSDAEIGRIYGVSPCSIRQIRIGASWKHLIT